MPVHPDLEKMMRAPLEEALASEVTVVAELDDGRTVATGLLEGGWVGPTWSVPPFTLGKVPPGPSTHIKEITIYTDDWTPVFVVDHIGVKRTVRAGDELLFADGISFELSL